jgi:xanthine dehydrogenase YagR molybdenum-binding subunit
MKFDTPATTNPIDQGKVVGKPADRIDGPLKTTGTAPYAYERHDVAPNAAYGWVIGAGIAKGRIRGIDLEAARRAPGAGRDHDRDRAVRGFAGQGQVQHRQVAGRP